jgi:hypothetical protein
MITFNESVTITYNASRLHTETTTHRTLGLDNVVPSSQALSSPVATRARAPGFYKELSSPDEIPPPPSGGDAAVNGPKLLYCLGHDTPNRKTRHLVRKSPLKQKLAVLLDFLALDNQSVNDFPEQGYTPEPVKGTQGTHQRKQSTQGQRNLQ